MVIWRLFGNNIHHSIREPETATTTNKQKNLTSKNNKHFVCFLKNWTFSVSRISSVTDEASVLWSAFRYVSAKWLVVRWGRGWGLHAVYKWEREGKGDERGSQPCESTQLYKLWGPWPQHPHALHSNQFRHVQTTTCYQSDPGETWQTLLPRSTKVRRLCQQNWFGMFVSLQKSHSFEFLLRVIERMFGSAFLRMAVIPVVVHVIDSKDVFLRPFSRA